MTTTTQFAYAPESLKSVVGQPWNQTTKSLDWDHWYPVVDESGIICELAPAAADTIEEQGFIDRLTFDDAAQCYRRQTDTEEGTTVTIDLSWTHESCPGWDSTGTIAESWYASHGDYSCRIDRFNDDDGGGYAYTVERHGVPVARGENMPADSFDDAEEKAQTLLEG